MFSFVIERFCSRFANHFEGPCFQLFSKTFKFLQKRKRTSKTTLLADTLALMKSMATMLHLIFLSTYVIWFIHLNPYFYSTLGTVFFSEEYFMLLFKAMILKISEKDQVWCF